MTVLNKKRRTLFISIIALTIFVLTFPYFLPLSDYQGYLSTKPFPESNLVEINGVLIHYREWIPNNPFSGKVLLIHGLGGSTYSWRNNIDQLVKAGYLVIALDLPGFGYSDRKIFAHSQENRAKLIWELLSYIDNYLSSEMKFLNWHLVGHSMGGGTILAMAVLNPSRVQSLAFVAGAIYQQTSSPLKYLLYLPPGRRWLGVFIENFLIKKKNIESFLSQAYGKKPNQEEIDKHLEPLVIPGTAKALTYLILTSKNLVPDRLAVYTGPLIGIWGSEDSWVKPELGRRFKTDFIKAEYREISGAYHCPMETHSEIFNEILINFLDNNN